MGRKKQAALNPQLQDALLGAGTVGGLGLLEGFLDRPREDEDRITNALQSGLGGAVMGGIALPGGRMALQGLRNAELDRGGGGLGKALPDYGYGEPMWKILARQFGKASASNSFTQGGPHRQTLKNNTATPTITGKQHPKMQAAHRPMKGGAKLAMHGSSNAVGDVNKNTSAHGRLGTGTKGDTPSLTEHNSRTKKPAAGSHGSSNAVHGAPTKAASLFKMSMLGRKMAGWKTEQVGMNLSPLGMIGSPFGMIASGLTPTRTLPEQAESDEETWKNILMPGRANYNWMKRMGSMIRSPEMLALKRKQKKEKGPDSKEEEEDKALADMSSMGKESGWKTEIAGSAVNPLNWYVGNPAGMLTAAGTKTRTLPQQAKADEETWRNILMPGRATYNQWKRVGAGIRSPEMLALKRKMKKRKPKDDEDQEAEEDKALADLGKAAALLQLKLAGDQIFVPKGSKGGLGKLSKGVSGKSPALKKKGKLRKRAGGMRPTPGMNRQAENVGMRPPLDIVSGGGPKNLGGGSQGAYPQTASGFARLPAEQTPQLPPVPPQAQGSAFTPQAQGRQPLQPPTPPGMAAANKAQGIQGTTAALQPGLFGPEGPASEGPESALGPLGAKLQYGSSGGQATGPPLGAPAGQAQPLGPAGQSAPGPGQNWAGMTQGEEQQGFGSPNALGGGIKSQQPPPPPQQQQPAPPPPPQQQQPAPPPQPGGGLGGGRQGAQPMMNIQASARKVNLHPIDLVKWAQYYYLSNPKVRHAVQGMGKSAALLKIACVLKSADCYAEPGPFGRATHTFKVRKTGPTEMHAGHDKTDPMNTGDTATIEATKTMKAKAAAVISMCRHYHSPDLLRKAAEETTKEWANRAGQWGEGQPGLIPGTTAPDSGLLPWAGANIVNAMDYVGGAAANMAGMGNQPAPKPQPKPLGYDPQLTPRPAPAPKPPIGTGPTQGSSAVGWGANAMKAPTMGAMQGAGANAGAAGAAPKPPGGAAGMQPGAPQ